MSKSQKGSAFERRICNQLSLWWSEGKNDAIFWRTSNSGGRATVRSRKGKETKNHHGDITAIDPIGQPLLDLITMELKRGYNKFTIQDLMDKPEKAREQKYEEWFRKAEASRKLAGTPYWIVIAQRDRREPLIFMPADFHGWLGLLETSKALTLETGEGIFVCVLLKEFFQLVDPRDLEKAARK